MEAPLSSSACGWLGSTPAASCEQRGAERVSAAPGPPPVSPREGPALSFSRASPPHLEGADGLPADEVGQPCGLGSLAAWQAGRRVGAHTHHMVEMSERPPRPPIAAEPLHVRSLRLTPAQCAGAPHLWRAHLLCAWGQRHTPARQRTSARTGQCASEQQYSGCHAPGTRPCSPYLGRHCTGRHPGGKGGGRAGAHAGQLSRHGGGHCFCALENSM